MTSSETTCLKISDISTRGTIIHKTTIRENRNQNILEVCR